MLFLKKIFLGLGALFLIFVGGSGTQSSSILLQGGGFVGLIAGLVVLYIFGRLVWRAMGCLPSLIVLGGIVGFLLYAIGAFNGGIQNVIPNVQKFLGSYTSSKNTSQTQSGAIELIDEENQTPPMTIGENFSDVQTNDNDQEQTARASVPNVLVNNPAPTKTPESSEGGIMRFVNNLIGGNDSVSQTKNFNPNDYPAVYGSVNVVSGDTLVMRNHYIRLYGIDAPEPNQTCADTKGRSYACGKEATRWLQGWISDNEIECHVLKQDSKGNVVGTCAYGQYDLGAALVSSGWAVTLPSNAIYKPYEVQAQKAKRGMWQGQFYKPWDWLKIQRKKPKIKIIKPKTQKRLWDYM